MVWIPLRHVYKPLLAYAYSWVSHGEAPPSTCTHVEEQAVSVAPMNNSWIINDHILRTTLFFILKGSSYFQVCAFVVSVEHRQVQEDMGKEGWQQQQITVLLPALGPDLTWHAILGMGMMWWRNSHILSKLESLQCLASGLMLRKLELLYHKHSCDLEQRKFDDCP